MSTESNVTSLPLRTTKQSSVHPLASLSSDEIKNAVSLLKTQWPAKTDLHFKQVTVQEPPKAEAVPYIEAECRGQRLPHLDRKVFVTYYLRKTVSADVRC